MHRTSRRVRQTACAVGLITLLAACGSDSGDEDAVDAAPGTGTSSESASGGAESPPPPTPPEGVVPFEDAAAGSGDGLTIGFTQLSLAVPFGQDVQEGVEAQIEKSGAKLITCDSELDAAKALNCARQFSTQDVDGLITFQADAAAAQNICEAGPDVPVFAVDIVQDPCQVAFVGAANTYAGEVLGYNIGLYFLDKFDCKHDAFISLESTAVGEVNEQRMGGIRDGFESVCGEIKGLRKLDTGAGGQADAAQQQMTDTLTALPGAKRIITVGLNEDVITAALAAARTQNRVENLYLGVQNFDPENCTIYDAPGYIGSTAYFPERYGELLVPNMIRAIKGEKVPAELLVPHEFISLDNVDEFYPDFSC